VNGTAQTETSLANPSHEKKGSIRALQLTNFFLADVQTGLGPFVAAYLASTGWQPDRVGQALTVAGVVTVVLQSPAGWLVDRIERKRLILIAGTIVLAVGALLLAASQRPLAVYTSQMLIGGSGAFLGPTLAAITMGIVGVKFFDRQFGRNQGFNSAGNLFAAALIAVVSHFFGGSAIFVTAAVLTIPTILCTLSIHRRDIDPELARGGCEKEESEGEGTAVVRKLLSDKVLLLFLVCAFLFHLANAAMLPQLGELLAHGSAKAAAPFMSGCIAITQCTIMLSANFVGRFSSAHGRKTLLLIGFAALPIRAVLYTLFHAVPALLAVQLLDGVANAIFGVVSILVIADRTRGTGRFNLGQGALATAVGLGAALSTTLGGQLIKRFGYNTSFLTLGALACIAFLLLFVSVPETGTEGHPTISTTS
jgi:predicted MFS family arabinose efflux permease